MSRYEVTVTAEWRSAHTFEFETAEDAQRFSDRVGSGGEDGLAAIIEAGDVRSDVAELVDWSDSGVVERG